MRRSMGVASPSSSLSLCLLCRPVTRGTMREVCSMFRMGSLLLRLVTFVIHYTKFRVLLLAVVFSVRLRGCYRSLCGILRADCTGRAEESSYFQCCDARETATNARARE